jgi:hypothetical protein
MKSIEPPYFFVGSAGFYIVGILLVALVLYAIKRWIIHARSQQADGQDLIGKIAYWGKAVPVDLESD